MRQAGLPIPTMSHALSASEDAINSLLCSPPVKSIAGPCGEVEVEVKGTL